MIEYCFEISKGRSLRFEVSPDREFEPRAKESERHAFWTLLSFHQCRNCPLRDEEYPRCPAALDAEKVINSFDSLDADAQVTVSVKRSERTYVKQCKLYEGLMSLLGLIMATSGCPLLNKMRLLGRFHLPFATAEETLFRAIGSYLVEQYFIQKDGGTPDFELKLLDAYYRDLATLNSCFVHRVRAASDQSPLAEAIIGYWELSSDISESISDRLDKYRHIFMTSHGIHPAGS